MHQSYRCCFNGSTASFGDVVTRCILAINRIVISLVLSAAVLVLEWTVTCNQTLIMEKVMVIVD
jgi:hypothetical protein